MLLIPFVTQHSPPPLNITCSVRNVTSLISLYAGCFCEFDFKNDYSED